ncbi:MAG: hypothetical protein HQL15_04380, partial [Candidatus Omnitrophica bacterium]|nr:hypothetical protein [Candidatus Omnitrophota bacterium]
GGCKNCRMTGYWGRQAICEILILSDEIRSMVMRRVSGADIKQMVMTALKDIFQTVHALGLKTFTPAKWAEVKSQYGF